MFDFKPWAELMKEILEKYGLLKALLAAWIPGSVAVALILAWKAPELLEVLIK